MVSSKWTYINCMCIRYLIDNHIVVFDSLLCALREVVSENIHDSMKKLDHKQRRD